jgi:hypothetical protein
VRVEIRSGCKPSLQRRHIGREGQAEGIGGEYLAPAAAVAMDGEGQAKLQKPADGKGVGLAGRIEGHPGLFTLL